MGSNFYSRGIDSYLVLWYKNKNGNMQLKLAKHVRADGTTRIQVHIVEGDRPSPVPFFDFAFSPFSALLFVLAL